MPRPPLMDPSDIAAAEDSVPASSSNGPDFLPPPGKNMPFRPPNIMDFRRTKSDPRDELRTFRFSLFWLALDQSTAFRVAISWLVAFFLAIVVPILYLVLVSCSGCDKNHAHPFDGVVQVSEASLAVISFACLSHNLRKYGLRRFLFLDQISEESFEVQNGYQAELSVCSAVQLVGFVICLHGAARITHRAQRIVSIVSQWHAMSTCQLYSETVRDKEASNSTSVDCVESERLLGAEYDSDLDSAFSVCWNSNEKISYDVASFQMRQALVTCLQHNSAGISIFGFLLDRTLLQMLFMLELSLVLWLLGQTVGITLS